jgi:hypothetical protein
LGLPSRRLAPSLKQSTGLFLDARPTLKWQLAYDQLFDLFLLQAGVLAEFFYAQELVLELVEFFANGLHHPDALAVTFSGNSLYVLWVNTQSFGFFFHLFLGGLWVGFEWALSGSILLSAFCFFIG